MGSRVYLLLTLAFYTVGAVHVVLQALLKRKLLSNALLSATLVGFALHTAGLSQRWTEADRHAWWQEHLPPGRPIDELEAEVLRDEPGRGAVLALHAELRQPRLDRGVRRQERPYQPVATPQTARERRRRASLERARDGFREHVVACHRSSRRPAGVPYGTLARACPLR